MTPDSIIISLSTTGKYAWQYTAIVSPEDADLVDLNWNVSIANKHRQYAMRHDTSTGSRETFLLHRVVMARKLGRPLESHEIVDHQDTCGLNCCRDNLRLATRSQNAVNSRRNNKPSSGYKGVVRSPRARNWVASIMVDGKRIHLGLYDTPEEAHAVYLVARKKYYGDFVPEDEL